MPHADEEVQQLLPALFGCLLAAPSGAKVVSLVLKAFGLRAPGTVHVPGGWLVVVVFKRRRHILF